MSLEYSTSIELLSRDRSFIIHSLFRVALSLQGHTAMSRSRQTHTATCWCTCPTEVFTTCAHTKTASINWVSWTRPAFQQNNLFLPLPPLLRRDGVQAVYKHDIWQSERSSGGYCVIPGKWLTPGEGWGAVACCASKRPWRIRAHQNVHCDTGRKITARYLSIEIFPGSINMTMLKLPPPVCEPPTTGLLVLVRTT